MSGFDLVFPEFQRLDLITPYIQAEQVRASRLQQEQTQQSLLQAQQKFQRDMQANQLAGLALQGNQQALSALQQIAPQTAIDLQQSIASNKKSQLELRKSGDEQAAADWGNIVRLTSQTQKNPKNWSMTRNALAGIFQRSGIQQELPMETPSPEELSQLRSHAEFNYRALTNPESLTAFGKQAEDEGFIRGTPEYEARIRAINIESHKQRISEKRAGKTDVNVFSGIEPTGAQQSKIQSRIDTATEALANIDALKSYVDDYSPYLSGLGRAELKTAILATQAGIATDRQRALVDLDQQVTSQVGAIFEPIKIQLSGVAQPTKEYDSLQKKIIDKQLNDVQFKRALEFLEQQQQLIADINTELLTQGYAKSPKEYRERFRDLYNKRSEGFRRFVDGLNEQSGKAPSKSSQATKPYTDEELNAYGRSLEGPGVSREEIVRKVAERARRGK